MDRFKFLRKAQEPRKILKVSPSKYEASKVMQSNRKYWCNILNNLSDTKLGPVSKYYINIYTNKI